MPTGTQCEVFVSLSSFLLSNSSHTCMELATLSLDSILLFQPRQAFCMSAAACGHRREIFFFNFFISKKLLAFMGSKLVISPLSVYPATD